MTFKHVKFEDSAVMRSLEKLAKEKGLVDSRRASAVKTASAPDLGFPQASTLMENVLRLCAGLRHAGFEKHAQDIEEKFMAFKKADTIYETSKEKGEDLIDAAHPKGSHKLENVDGEEAVFETILDQHLKNLKMIDKTPTGKLAKQNTLDAVKIVLADLDVPTKLSGQSYNELKHQTDVLYDKVDSWVLLPGSGITDDTEFKANSLVSYIRSTLLSNKVTTESLNNSVKMIDEVLKSIGSTFWTKETDIAKMLYAMKDYINNFIRPEHDELKNKKPEPSESSATQNPVMQKIKKAMNQYSGLYALVSSDSDPKFAAQKEKTLGWIKGVIGKLNEYVSDYSKLDEESKQAQAEYYSAAIDKIMSPYKDVYDDWK